MKDGTRGRQPPLEIEVQNQERGENVEDGNDESGRNVLMPQGDSRAQEAHAEESFKEMMNRRRPCHGTG